MKIYQIIEQGKGIRENYTMGFETEAELSSYLKGKQEMIGFIPGLGGDKSYSIVAWELNDPAQYVDMEKIWNRF